MNIKGIGKVIALVAIAAVAIYIVTQIKKPDVTQDKIYPDNVVQNPSSLKTNALQQELSKVESSVTKDSNTNSVETMSEVAEEAGTTVAKEVPPTAEEQQVLDEIDEFIGEDELKKVVQAAQRIMNSTNPDVRREAADAFGWVGVQGIKNLSRMLNDPDPDVAGDAFDNWDSAVDEIEDDATKANVLVDGIKTLTDQDALESAFMDFDNMDNDIAVPKIVDIIETGTPIASEVGREHYEFTTGEIYQSPEAAAAWVVQDMAE